MLAERHLFSDFVLRPHLVKSRNHVHDETTHEVYDRGACAHLQAIELPSRGNEKVVDIIVVLEFNWESSSSTTNLKPTQTYHH